MKLSEKLTTLILTCVRNTGSYNSQDWMYQIEESLTFDEYDVVESFSTWVVDNNKKFGSESIQAVYSEYLKVENVDFIPLGFNALIVDRLRSETTDAQAFIPRFFQTYDEALNHIWSIVCEYILDGCLDHYIDSYYGNENLITKAQKVNKLNSADSNHKKEVIEWKVAQSNDEDFLSFWYISKVPD